MLQAFESSAAPTSRREATVNHRFWNETDRLLGMFESYRESSENANAIPCFGRLAKFRFDEISNQPNFNPAKRSIISIFQPKSGGTFLHNRLLQLGYQEFWWLFSNRLCPSVCYASDEALRYYLSGGCTCHSHARPDANILAALDRAGVEKIWVHLRNPIEAVISSYHHYLGEGHGEGALGEERARESLSVAHRLGLHENATKSSFVIKHVGWHLEWVAEWLRYAQSQPGSVVVSYHDELGDPQALFTRVFRELGLESPDRIDCVPAPDDRFRAKATADWCHDLTSEARDYLELRARAELQLFPEFNRLWPCELSAPHATG